MGTEEKEAETAAGAAQPTLKEPASLEKEPESPADFPQTPERYDSPKPDTCQSSSMGAAGAEVKEGATASPASTLEKLQKASTNKWKTMQNWRKALSEDPGDKAGRGGEGSKPHGGGKRSRFKRAQSEPPGGLLSALAPAASEASPSTESSQKGAAGGGMLFKKYLRSMSQKLRPRLPSRTSNPSLLTDVVEPEQGLPVLTEPKPNWVPAQEVPLWNIGNCVLEHGQIIIAQEDEPTMWTRNRVSSFLSNLSMQNLLDIECSPDNVALAGPRPKNQDGGVLGLIKKRRDLKGKRNSTTQLLNAKREYGSSNSISVPVLPSLDLSSDSSTVIRPVHSSILGEKYCFEVINSENTHCFGCTSASERDRWIEELRRAAQPNKDNIERTENSLCLWVNEAKELPPKKRYFCEVHLDGTLFARTSSRTVGKNQSRSSLAGEAALSSNAGLNSSGAGAAGCQLFWGEFFELDNLPSVSQITLHLFREEDPKRKRQSRDESTLQPVGSVSIALAEIRGRSYVEKWYPVVPYKPAGSGTKETLGPQALLRIKARFQNLQVLPMEKYKEFAEYVTMDYVEMCTKLEPLLNVKEKEELAGALVHVLQSIGKAKEFLVDLGSAEVDRLGENEALIFRENTLATKAIDEYMKLVGQKYLIETLGDFISRLYSSAEVCEVDPRKCPAVDLSNHQKHLKETCEEVVQKIIGINGTFPEELNRIFSCWMEVCEDRGRPQIGQRLISASLFLRFLCPAILSPSLFNLTQTYPEPPTLRTLTLTAKVIQNLANFTQFGEKEEYMLFMNDFLEQHWDSMRDFLQTVSNPDSDVLMGTFDGYVDLPLRLAVLHGLLVDIVYQRDQETIDKLYPLPSILNQISDSLGPDAPRILVTSQSDQKKPMYVPPKDLSKFSPLQSSTQQLPLDVRTQRDSESRTWRRSKGRKAVQRTQSAPHRPPGQRRYLPKRQTSTEDLPMSQDLDQTTSESDQPHITSPQTAEGKPPAPVPWIRVNHKRDSREMKTQGEDEEFSVLEKHSQELSELRLGLEQVTEQELDLAKRLEDFINQNQDQNALLQEQNSVLQAEVQELRNLLTAMEEQLASATFRLGVIEEEREEEERKLSVAIAAAERMNVLEEKVAGLQTHVTEININSA